MGRLEEVDVRLRVHAKYRRLAVVRGKFGGSDPLQDRQRPRRTLLARLDPAVVDLDGRGMLQLARVPEAAHGASGR